MTPAFHWQFKTSAVGPASATVHMTRDQAALILPLFIPWLLRDAV